MDADNVIHLAFSNQKPEADVERIAVYSCSRCNNKTFLILAKPADEEDEMICSVCRHPASLGCETWMLTM